MTRNLGRERITAIFDWVFLAKYLPRFLTMCNLHFVRPDKGEHGLANKIFNTFCEWLGGAPRYSLLSYSACRLPAKTTISFDKKRGSIYHGTEAKEGHT
jgi:hypothetical protein